MTTITLGALKFTADIIPPSIPPAGEVRVRVDCNSGYTYIYVTKPEWLSLEAYAGKVGRLREDAQAARLETITALGEAAELERERDAYRAMLCDLLASAHPHPTEHPTMARQWERARELLKNGPASSKLAGEGK